MSKARQLADLGNVYDDGALSNRNLIINGAMQVAQRGSTFTAPNNAYTLDRYQVYQANGAVFDVKTSTDAPDGFESSLELDCTTAAASPAAGAYFQIVQRIEGYNVQQLAYGTSSAKKITLSFYVKSNKTGTYQVNFRRSTAPAQMANKTYTINSADTWERKSVTVDGATGFSLTGGNAEGLMIDWWYHSGTDFTSGSGSETYIALASTNYNASATANLGDSTSNYLRITGVQLECSDTATPFEHPRSYGEELARCQRYYEKLQGTGASGNYAGFGTGFSNGSFGPILVTMRTPKRANPTFTYSGTFRLLSGTGATTFGIASDTYIDKSGTGYINLNSFGVNTGTGYAIMVTANDDADAYFAFDSEL